MKNYQIQDYISVKKLIARSKNIVSFLFEANLKWWCCLFVEVKILFCQIKTMLTCLQLELFEIISAWSNSWATNKYLRVLAHWIQTEIAAFNKSSADHTFYYHPCSWNGTAKQSAFVFLLLADVMSHMKALHAYKIYAFTYLTLHTYVRKIIYSSSITSLNSKP